MKKVLITGANSYIGTSFENYILSNFSNDYQIDTLDMIGDSWKTFDFSKYDSVFHVAGIAHQKETPKNKKIYYDINRDLTIELAKTVKNAGASQFIVLSSMSVYGLSTGHISKATHPNPVNAYGDSKLQADIALQDMSDESFKVVILRPPMVYGKYCKGNYQKLRKAALKLPLFPNFHNERSMLFIGNLVTFVKELIDEEREGLFFPQDAEYVCTYEMVKRITQYNKKKIVTTRVFNILIFIMLGFEGNIKKIFGNLIYEKVDLIDAFSFEEAMRLIENNNEE